MNKTLRMSLDALIALSCAVTFSACSATNIGSTSASVLEQPGRAHSIASIRIGPALVAFNRNDGTLEFWPIRRGGGNHPQQISGPLEAGVVTNMAGDGQAVAMAAYDPAAVVVFHIPTQTKRTFPDPFGIPIDIAIDKNEALYVANLGSPNGNITMYPPESPHAVLLDCRLVGLPEAVAVDNEGDIFVNGYLRRTQAAGVVEIPVGPGGPEPQNCVRLQLKAERGYVAGIAVDPKTDDLIVLDDPDDCAGGVEGRMTVYPKPYQKDTGVSHDLGANCAGSIRLSADSTRVFVSDEDVSGSTSFILQRSFPNGADMGRYNGGNHGGFTTIPNILPN